MRKDPAHNAEPSLVVPVSHLIAYWVQTQPLGELMGNAVDGGTDIRPDLWHPLRVPRYQNPEQVRALYSQLRDEWAKSVAAHPVPQDDWHRIEIEKVLRVYAHATMHGECVVSALQEPADEARTRKVRVPIRLR